MSAIPAYRQSSAASGAQLKVVAKRRAPSTSMVFGRIVLFLAVCSAAYLVSAMFGSVAVEQGRQASINARDQAGVMRSRQAFLQQEVASLNRDVVRNSFKPLTSAATTGD